MRTLIRHITRKSRGGVAVREESSEDEVLVIGRGSGCAIHLPDPRILLNHAQLLLRNNEVFATALSNADLRINGNIVQAGKVSTRDVVQLGPYELKLESIGPGSETSTEGEAPPDLVLSVELVRPLGDDLNQLLKRSRIDIKRIGLPLRTWAWLLAIGVLTALFAYPFTLNLFHPKLDARTLTQAHHRPPPAPTGIWSSGEISSSHKFFGVACETCHEKPFIPVQNTACLTCHEGIERHMSQARFPDTHFAEAPCSDCHEEHHGNISITLKNQVFCTSCHKDLSRTTPNVGLRDVSDFGVGHTEFRPTVLVDTTILATDRSREIGATPAPMENNGLKFSHAAHLEDSGIRDPRRGVVKLDCGDCHVLEGQGHSMQPVSFETACHGCHQLRFDAHIPDRELLHGKATEVFKQIRDIYDATALRGGYNESSAPPVVRRRPGTPLAPADREIAAHWASAKSTAIISGPLGKGLCGTCHVLTEINTPIAPEETNSAQTGAASWKVTPAIVTNPFLPRSFFTHLPHRDVACVTCHAAPASMSASDVLMPGVATCQSCHGGETSEDRVPSTCVSCHKFHRKEMGPMHLPELDADTDAESWNVRRALQEKPSGTPGQ